MKLARARVGSKKIGKRALAGMALSMLWGLSACQSPQGEPQSNFLPDVSQSDPSNPVGEGLQARPYQTAVLLFNGTGVSTSDWQTTELILQDQNLSYQLVNSAQLNAMSLEELSQFGVIVVPGGTGSTITQSLTVETRIRVRQAVRDFGVGYVGFCAGAWVAVGPEAASNSNAAYGLAVAPGEVLPAYYPGGTNATAVMAPVTFSSGAVRELVWWGGPSTPEWSQGVIARYATGEPAISQTFSGQGLVLISGPHPEAPQSWRATAGYDSDGLDYDVAIAMIQSALNRKPMAF